MTLAKRTNIPAPPNGWYTGTPKMAAPVHVLPVMLYPQRVLSHQVIRELVEHLLVCLLKTLGSSLIQSLLIGMVFATSLLPR